MCGIAAIFRTAPGAPGTAPVRAMTELVEHRGPDGERIELLSWSGGTLASVDDVSPWSIALGHRRLKILDPSAHAAQPMRRGELRMLFNGAVYNFVELRAELEELGHRFESTGDTEVVLASYEQWGTACFERFRGMWAIVLVDGRRGELVLSRDRLGIKPLYLAQSGRALYLCSEIKQLTAVPGLRLSADLEVVADYLLSGYERRDRTFFEQVEPFPEGRWRRCSLATLERLEECEYWAPQTIAPTVHDPDEAASQLRESLETSVSLHLRSDAPLGVSLSGGLDSGALAALAVDLRRGDEGNLPSFTATFPDDPVDERRYVEEMTAGRAIEAHYVEPTPALFLSELDELTWHHDEPVGSLSQYAAFRVARAMRERGVRVALNGQGGDEILAGYWQSYFAYLRRLIADLRLLKVGGHFVGALAGRGNSELLRQPLFLLRRYRQRRAAGERTEARIRSILAMDPQERRLYELRELFLPRLLRWDDRNLMASSVEGRYPFLDHEVIATAMRFAPEALYRAGWTKLPLRRAMRAELPASILARRDKQGFETPQEAWLAGALRSLAERFVERDSPVWSIVDPQRLIDARGAPQRHQTLLRAIFVDRWMRRFDVSVAEAA